MQHTELRRIFLSNLSHTTPTDPIELYLSFLQAPPKSGKRVPHAWTRLWLHATCMQDCTQVGEAQEGNADWDGLQVGNKSTIRWHHAQPFPCISNEYIDPASTGPTMVAGSGEFDVCDSSAGSSKISHG